MDGQIVSHSFHCNPNNQTDITGRYDMYDTSNCSGNAINTIHMVENQCSLFTNTTIEPLGPVGIFITVSSCLSFFFFFPFLVKVIFKFCESVYHVTIFDSDKWYKLLIWFLVLHCDFSVWKIQQKYTKKQKKNKNKKAHWV